MNPREKSPARDDGAPHNTNPNRKERKNSSAAQKIGNAHGDTKFAKGKIKNEIDNTRDGTTHNPPVNRILIHWFKTPIQSSGCIKRAECNVPSMNKNPPSQQKNIFRRN